MSDEGQPRKRPITGRSAKDRALDRADSAAKAQAAAKKRRAALETTVNITVGAKAMSIAARYPMIRSLIASAAAADHEGTDLGDVLNVKAAGADALDAPLDYNAVWKIWESVRRLNKTIDEVWVTIENTTPQDVAKEAEQFDKLCREIQTLAAEWGAIVGAEHPLQRLLRVAS